MSRQDQGLTSNHAHSIRYVADAPRSDDIVEIAEGIRWFRQPLPFALDHVNLWIVDDGDSYTAVDSGHGNPEVQALWTNALETALSQKPISRVIGTHFHPDHAGNLGWLCQRTGAALWMTELEFVTARALELDDREGYGDTAARYFEMAGAPDDIVDSIRQRGNAYRRGVSEPPRMFTRLRAGDVVKTGGCEWRVMIGQGHAPEMICLYSADRNVLIAADQLLPRITPVIGAWHAIPEADPITDFVRSNQQFRGLPEDVLVLPSHGRPYTGLHTRLDELDHHHDERLARTLELCREPVVAFDVMKRLFDRKLDRHQIGFAVAETLAHLNHLIAQDEIERTIDARNVRHYRTLS